MQIKGDTMHTDPNLRRKPRRLSLLVAIAVVAALAFAVGASAQKIITFDVPGAGTGAGQGTIPYGINPVGDVIGWFVDGNNVSHGFVRNPWGKITTFDAPGAGTGAGQGTSAYGMNTLGVIVGYFTDNNGVVHGFVRDLWGRITTFDAPNAGTSAGQGTWFNNINDAGEISGAGVDGSNAIYGFVVTPSGHYTTYEAPGSGTGYFQGTDSPTFYALNPAGMGTGWYVDGNYCVHGWVRSPSGELTSFDDPKALCFTLPVSLNLRGEVAGF